MLEENKSLRKYITSHRDNVTTTTTSNTPHLHTDLNLVSIYFVVYI